MPLSKMYNYNRLAYQLEPGWIHIKTMAMTYRHINDFLEGAGNYTPAFFVVVPVENLHGGRG